MFNFLKTIIKAIPIGMSVTFKHLFKKPVTLQYPEQMPDLSPRFRGLHYLARYEDGEERCVCCGLCAAACPSECIYMEPMENESGERKARIYIINEIRCIFCGYCEEACPEEAIFLGRDFEFSKYKIPEFIYDKEMLLNQFDEIDKERRKEEGHEFIRKSRFHFRGPTPSHPKDILGH
ncbi:MAG: NADH-quinone oxidoreductase subunit NuoI [candidate division Zixibacteria bacterium]|nr:NADH-quinone oxidoreductase subunit NuoI [candidate division Zixibacteria bacterium]